ncbi:MAG: hypothetical protein IKD25_08215 [Bacteroidaceae bacterium]|nr:hypothetical protein [Bacteroidaceae bacterium]
MSIPYRKTRKKILSPDGTMRKAWVMQQVSYPPIKFNDFVKECVVSQGVSASHVKGISEALSNRLRHYFETGHSVQLEGIGTLKPVFNAACADTPEELGNECVRQIKLRFYPHKEFQESMKHLELVDLDLIQE